MNKDDYNFKLWCVVVFYIFILFSLPSNEHSALPVLHFNRRANSKNLENNKCRVNWRRGARPLSHQGALFASLASIEKCGLHGGFKGVFVLGEFSE